MTVWNSTKIFSETNNIFSEKFARDIFISCRNAEGWGWSVNDDGWRVPVLRGTTMVSLLMVDISRGLVIRASNEGLQRFHNHREGPYKGLLVLSHLRHYDKQLPKKGK